MGPEVAQPEDGRRIEPAVFQQVSRLVYRHAGILLKPGKEALVGARLAKRMRELGLPSARSYLRHLAEDRSGRELVEFLDVMSTNFTRFYREPQHIEKLAEAARHWASPGRELRFWSAACSTGEEPYSMAMALTRALEGSGAGFRILATDISTRVLRFAEAGRYREPAMASVGERDRVRFFRHDRQDGCWCVRPELKARVRFARLNLSAPPFPMKGPFDAVFCRNVMIYFDAPVRGRLVSAIETLLRPGGLLFVGQTESLVGLPSGLAPVGASVYRR